MSSVDNLKETLGQQFSAAQASVETVRATWDDRELIALGKLSNSDQKNRKSRVSIGDLSTIVLERSGRTVAQLPSGKVRAVSKVDESCNRLLELVIQRYVIPNANDQFPLPIKLFLIDYLSDPYGGIDVLSYWRVDDEYVGPDCQILNPRSVFWQAGKTNTQQAEYVFVSTFVSRAWLEGRKKLPNWNAQAINKVLKMAKDRGGAKPAAREDARRQSQNDQSKNSTASWGNTEEFELVTKYERGKKGKWISFLPDYDNEIIRNIDNPDPSGRIPVIRKLPQLPMIDSITGQGAIERGESLAKTLDSITNLTHDGLKYALYPVTKFNGSIVKRSTLKWQPGAFWNMSDPNAVQTHEVGSSAMNTFLPIQQFLTAKLLNQNGTTSTQISESDKIPGYGKTPTALKQQAERESTMDRLARDRLEIFYGELIEHWISMLVTKQEKPLEFYIYDEELNQMTDLPNGVEMKVNPGAKERINANGEKVFVLGTGKISIPKGKLKGQYKYIVDTSSSMLKDDAEEHEKLTEILMTVLKVGPDQINAWLAQEGESLSVAGLIKRWMISGGAKDWDEIIQDAPINQQMQQPGMVDPMMEQQMVQQGMQQPPMQPQMSIQPQQVPPMGEYQPDPFTEQIVQQIQQGGF